MQGSLDIIYTFVFHSFLLSFLVCFTYVNGLNLFLRRGMLVLFY